MNYILKAITDHPEAFFKQLKPDLSKEEQLEIIYSAKNLGTSIQQNLLNITKLYFGWTVLVKLGLRSIAMPMGIQLLETYNWNHHYQYAADICNQLMKHYYILGDGREAERYQQMFKEYRDTYSLEAEMESLYCKIIYKSDHGLLIDKKSILKDLKELESRLKFDSCRYHFYYYRCQCIINEGEQFEKWCLLGLAYFKNLYFKHEIYYNIFINNLYMYYLTIDKFKKVKDEIPKYFTESSVGSKSWFRLKYIYIIAQWNLLEVENSKKEMVYCQSLKKYNNLSKSHQEEWEYLASTINSKTHNKFKVKRND